MPPAEVILWSKLRGKGLKNHKFRRQYSVERYIMDFYCPALKLAIEIDGDSHFVEGAKEREQVRRRLIESYGVKILRFTNAEIYESLDGALEKIMENIPD